MYLNSGSLCIDTRDMFVSRFSWEDARYLSFGNALLKNAYEAELFDDFEFPALKNEYIDYQSPTGLSPHPETTPRFPYL